MPTHGKYGLRGDCGTGWHMYGVKIVLLLFNVGTQSNSYQAKLSSNFSFVQGGMYSVESIGKPVNT
jgi:hypothetical protein